MFKMLYNRINVAILIFMNKHKNKLIRRVIVKILLNLYAINF